MASVALFLTVSSVAVIAIVWAMDEEFRPHGHVSGPWVPRPVLLPGVILGLGNVTYAAMAGFLILLLHHRGHDTAWAFSAFAVAVLFGRAVFGRMPDRMGPRRSLLAGYACLAVGLIAIVAGLNWTFDVPAALLVGLGVLFPLAGPCIGSGGPGGAFGTWSGVRRAQRLLRSVRRRQFGPRRSCGGSLGLYGALLDSAWLRGCRHRPGVHYRYRRETPRTRNICLRRTGGRPPIRKCHGDSRRFPVRRSCGVNRR